MIIFTSVEVFLINIIVANMLRPTSKIKLDLEDTQYFN